MKLFRNFYSYSTYFAYVLLVLLLSSCGGDDDGDIVPEVVQLESSDVLFSRSKSEMVTLANFAGYPELAAYLNYDIKIYTITYKTDYLGQEIIASGLVAFPETGEEMPMMSFQHGTMVKHSDAPTVDTQTYGFLASVASAGYIFLIPDFIGFGSSSNILHPYYRADITASSVMDMMIAAKELASLEGYNFNGKTFLSGYSEGGFATMATHKAIEENGLEGFDLVASAPAAGGYDIKGMQEYFFSLETYHQPYYMAYVALSFKNTYGWNQPLSDFFQEPYATEIPGYFDGSMSGSSINNKLDTVVADFIAPDFLNLVDTDPKYDDMRNALEENSLDSWVPLNKMFMYHGTADITVPYQNSIDTYANLIAAGASSETIAFIAIEGADHGSGFFPYVEDVLGRFEPLK
ncbi:hypothetical protein JMN32_25340 [Fulvivirga sp. 29W222]|uniref:Uncharacterized protein n=1 Tax=Fulvivirga marina TaxID=2494733 RepID=A0A937KEJ6_9BACT|nr:lipase family protein [Fulvivirga marina]MBL6449659.1 hypothetical protein [Fulvivirga marina]